MICAGGCSVHTSSGEQTDPHGLPSELANLDLMRGKRGEELDPRLRRGVTIVGGWIRSFVNTPD